MKITVLKKTPDELKIEIEGAGHTLGNLLQKHMIEDERVDLAGYDVPHPLASNALVYVRTKNKAKPEDVIRQAAIRARELNKEFSKDFERALRKV